MIGCVLTIYDIKFKFKCFDDALDSVRDHCFSHLADAGDTLPNLKQIFWYCVPGISENIQTAEYLFTNVFPKIFPNLETFSMPGLVI